MILILVLLAALIVGALGFVLWALLTPTTTPHWRIFMTTSMNASQKVQMTAVLIGAAQTAKPTWELSPSAPGTLTVSDDGQTAEFVASGAGTCQVMVSGDGARPATESIVISEAPSWQITAAAPEAQ